MKSFPERYDNTQQFNTIMKPAMLNYHNTHIVWNK